ncbi:MAG: long-chain-fatty-acid--CoA ligase [Hyphomicrobiaceae bacterium]
MPTSNSGGRPPEIPQGRTPWLDHYPEGIDWSQEFQALPLGSLLDRAAGTYGDRFATNFFGKRLTYKTIADRTRATAAGLARIGVKKGTRVGLFLPNSPTFIIYYFAIAKAGGIVVHFNPLYTIQELERQIADSGTEIMVTLDLAMLFGKVETLLTNGSLPRAIVASFPDLLPWGKSLLYRTFKGGELARPKGSAAAGKIVFDDDLNSSVPGTDLVEPPIDPVNDVAVLQYTGGTTGEPKGAMLTHANVTSNVQQALAWVHDYEPGKERVLGALPFFHVFAMTAVMNFGVMIGAEIVLMPRFVLADALKLITTTRPTFMAGVPTMFIAMLGHPKLHKYDLSSLKACLSGGAPLLLETKRRFEDLTGCKVVEAYGLTEASPGVSINPFNGPVKELSIGQPLPATMVSLRDPSSPGREVAPGEKGELCVLGPQVMKGYWNRPEETAAQLTPDGFLRTGDIAEMDDEGFLFIVDRIKDLIICSGYNVYPRNIEEAISTYPAVEEVSVIGIQDDYRGEAPKAFIKLRNGMTATADDILAHLATKLSRIEMPAAIEFRDSLPKTMIGKLSKKELQEEERARQR